MPMKIGQHGRCARSEEDPVGRQDRPEPSQAPVDERLAHRALGHVTPRNAPAMSQQARDRLYERMFPQHICGSPACGDRRDERSD